MQRFRPSPANRVLLGSGRRLFPETQDKTVLRNTSAHQDNSSTRTEPTPGTGERLLEKC